MNKNNDFLPNMDNGDNPIKQYWQPNRDSHADNNTSIASTRDATAMLLLNGRVSTWGNGYATPAPTDIATLQDITSLSATSDAFTALRADRSVVAWSDPNCGGQIPSDITALKDIVNLSSAGSDAIAALRANGSVVAWGSRSLNIQVPPGIARLNDIISLSSTARSFAALRNNGQRLAWDVDSHIVHSEYDY
ncbi:hypothetical protein [Photorhabdus stackebrandtii]|uniref:Uncharacterized protein n=1 Tax=Photorhabdus stackebrandtii TaxID=1123042 RepID=A0A7X5TMZ0_9GAMM|nr:hypothetical protein [Photorhabdus stackebrandtii]NHB97592.1 hypothetical protein [Photorhabdus stackebrandtii]